MPAILSKDLQLAVVLTHRAAADSSGRRFIAISNI